MITFDEVTKRYADGTVAVDRLSLEAPTGEITVFVGPSGCGKTTSLRMINRMIDPTEGRVLLDGVDVTTIDPPTLRRGIGYVIQQAGLFPHRKIVDNVATVPHLLGWDRRKARARAMELLERVGLDLGLAERYPFQLSGGQQQRIALAAALARDPDLLIADEPTTALDATTQHEILMLLREVQRARGMGVLLITHDLRVAFEMCDRVAVMYAGRIVESGPGVDVAKVPAHPYTSGLLAALPSVTVTLPRLEGIPGGVPSAGDVTGTCAFAD
ncbi:oligopeptide/dipeptide ABC transporter ATP-binding protein, partial [Streptosporangium algeriense]